MRLSDLGELALVERIRKGFPAVSDAVEVGIGDDAAVVVPGPGRLLATTDVMVEGVHFDLAFVGPRELGFKLVSVNASDIYAMGGRPERLLLGLALTPACDTDFLDAFLAGVRLALDRYGMDLIGGDLSGAPGGIALSATVLGSAERPVLRGGARPGDSLYVTGPLGEAEAGLRLLRAIGRRVDLDRGEEGGKVPWEVMKPLVVRHLMPEVGPAPGGVTAMIDLSDGLFLDLTRLCEAGGVGARIYEERLPITDETRAAARALGTSALDIACTGGEDYRLLFAAPGGERADAVRIGEVVERGMTFVARGGGEREMVPRGYRHFGAGGAGCGDGGTGA